MEKPRLTVGVLILNNEGKIFLMKSPKWENRYLVPGGHVDFGETLEQAAKREVKEETNLDIYNIKFLMHLEFINPSDFHKKDLHFVGMQFTAKTNSTEVRLNEEGYNPLWIKPEEALNLDIQPQTKIAIKTLINQKK